MIRQYSRERRSDYVQFLNPDGFSSAIVPGRIVRRHFGVGSFIRIPHAEYPSTLKVGESISHINLPIHDGNLDELVLLCEIIQTGRVDHNGGVASRPLLSFANALLAVTTSYFSNISQDEAHSIITSPLISLQPSETMPPILHRRYQSVCNLTIEEAKLTNVALREFTVISAITPTNLSILSGKIRNS